MRLIQVGGVSALAVSSGFVLGAPSGVKDARIYEAPRLLRSSRYMMGCRGCHLVLWSATLDRAWTDARDHACVPGHVCAPPPGPVRLGLIVLAYAWWPYAWAAALFQTSFAAVLWLWLTIRQVNGNDDGGRWRVSAAASVLGLALTLTAYRLENLTKDTR